MAHCTCIQGFYSSNTELNNCILSHLDATVYTAIGQYLLQHTQPLANIQDINILIRGYVLSTLEQTVCIMVLLDIKYLCFNEVVTDMRCYIFQNDVCLLCVYQRRQTNCKIAVNYKMFIPRVLVTTQTIECSSKNGRVYSVCTRALHIYVGSQL